jgi:hypothetical protein
MGKTMLGSDPEVEEGREEATIREDNGELVSVPTR